jgi:hypothetical protein
MYIIPKSKKPNMHPFFMVKGAAAEATDAPQP